MLLLLLLLALLAFMRINDLLTFEKVRAALNTWHAALWHWPCLQQYSSRQQKEPGGNRASYIEDKWTITAKVAQDQ